MIRSALCHIATSINQSINQFFYFISQRLNPGIKLPLKLNASLVIISSIKNTESMIVFHRLHHIGRAT